MMKRLLLLTLTSAIVIACTEQGEEATLAAETKGESQVQPDSDLAVPAGLADAPLADWQRELLQIAFDGPTQMPLNPHIKNRADGQELAVNGALALEQYATAFRYSDSIPTYQRGVGFADLAFDMASRDPKFDYGPLFELCQQVLATPSQIAEVEQPWRKDMIRSKMAKTLILRGEMQQAAELVQGVEPSQAVHFEEMLASKLTAKEVEAQLEATPQLLESADLARQAGIIEGLVTLWIGQLDNPELRSRVRSTLNESWKGYPVTARVEALLKMAEAAATAGDVVTTLALVEEAKSMVSQLTLTMDAEVPLRATIAARRASVGENEQAIEELDAAMQIYEAHRGEVFDMFRGEALRPVAEAYLAAGDESAAMGVYKTVVHEGGLNINSRPRALDLTATCVSIATHGLKPDDELMEAIREAYAALGEPW